MINKYNALRFLLIFSLVDAASAWLLILLYTADVDMVWLVNVNLLTMTVCLLIFMICSFRITRLTILILVMVAISIIKYIFAVPAQPGMELRHIATYLTGLLLPISSLSFAAHFNKFDYKILYGILEKYAYRFAVISFIGIIAYALLYFSGHISYFGLGANLHYVYPFFLTKQGYLAALVFALVILISGKRASLINYMAQSAAYIFADFKKHWLKALLAILLVPALLMVTYLYTDFLDRFSWIFKGEYNFSDPYFLAISGGGRFEEVFGIYEYFLKNPNEIYFGAPPGAYYIWHVETSDYTVGKNYSHITLFGMIFRYGIIFTLLLYFYFVRVLISYIGSRDPLYLVFVGIFASTFFGASLFIDPTSWILVGLFLATRTAHQGRKLIW